MQLHLELTFAPHDGSAVEYHLKDSSGETVGVLEVALDKEHLSLRVRRVDESKTGAVRLTVI